MSDRQSMGMAFSNLFLGGQDEVGHEDLFWVQNEMISPDEHSNQVVDGGI